MTHLFIIIFWFITSFVLWIMTIFTEISNEGYKKYENKIRGFFFWLAVFFSLIVGMLIK